jgi:hypothetical protein
MIEGPIRSFYEGKHNPHEVSSKDIKIILDILFSCKLPDNVMKEVREIKGKKVEIYSWIRDNKMIECVFQNQRIGLFEQGKMVQKLDKAQVKEIYLQREQNGNQGLTQELQIFKKEILQIMNEYTENKHKKEDNIDDYNEFKTLFVNLLYETIELVKNQADEKNKKYINFPLHFNIPSSKLKKLYEFWKKLKLKSGYIKAHAMLNEIIYNYCCNKIQKNI